MNRIRKTAAEHRAAEHRADALRTHADEGYAKAQSNLGFMHYNGLGVPQDHAQAVSWYRKAAEQDSANAQINLGIMYLNGHGVPRDHDEAVRWFLQVGGLAHPVIDQPACAAPPSWGRRAPRITAQIIVGDSTGRMPHTALS